MSRAGQAIAVGAASWLQAPDETPEERQGVERPTVTTCPRPSTDCCPPRTPRAARADPRHRDQGAGAPGGRDGGEGGVPRGSLPAAREGRTAEPAVRGGVRRRCAALRGLPPGRRGDRDRMAERRRSARRSTPSPPTWSPPTPPTSSAPTGCRRCSPATGSAPTACPSRRPARTSAGSAPRRCRREEYVVTGTKQWISNGSCADYYILFARTSEDPRRGLSAFIVPADTAGMTFGAPEKKMGLACDVTTQVIFEGARIPAAQRIGDEGAGMRVALSALDAGRLGIAAVATGIAQAALAHAVAVRRRARAVRPDDRRVPGPPVPARRHGAPRSSGRGRRTSTPPGSRTPAVRSPARPASPSSPPPTPPCG